MDLSSLGIFFTVHLQVVVHIVPSYYAPNSAPVSFPDEPSANLLRRPCDMGSSDNHTARARSTSCFSFTFSGAST